MRLLFPSLFLCVYVFASLVAPLPCRLWIKAAAGLFLLAVSMKYIVYEAAGGSFFAPSLPRFLQIGQEAMYGALVVLFVLLLLKDAVLLALWIARKLGVMWSLPFSPANAGLALALVAFCVGIWGTWQSVRSPDAHTVEIPLANLPPELDGFSIVQLSDIHIGPLLKGDWLRSVVEKTNALSPDVVVLTGDFNDGQPEELAGDIAPLGDLQARYGVYGVTGNHEYYFGADKWVALLKGLRVDMLENEHRVLRVNGKELVIVGLPDATARRYDLPGPDLHKALAGAPETAAAPRVLLAHQPREAGKHADAVDLQLSGHTHGGLMFFMSRLLAAFNEGFVRGLYGVGDMKLYVSPGTGLWGGFSCRVGVPSEITRVVLRSGPGTE